MEKLIVLLPDMFTFITNSILFRYNIVVLIVLLLLSKPLIAHSQATSIGKISDLQRFSAIDSLVQRNKLEEAEHVLTALVNKSKTTKEDWLLGKAYAGLGNIFLIKGKFDNALENYLLSLRYLENKGYPVDVAKIYANLATLYSKLKQFPIAEDYLLKALKQDLGENNKLKYLANLAGIYVERGKRAEALNTFKQAVLLAKSLKNKAVEAILYTNLSNYFIQEKQWDEAIVNAQKSVRLRTYLKQAPSVITLNNLGYALVQEGNYKEGVGYYERALQNANLAEKKQLYYNLYQAYKLLGNSQKTWNYIESYDRVKDSLSTLNYEQKVAELAATYQAAQKQRKIEQLAVENNLQRIQLKQQTYLMFAGIFILLLILGIGYLKWKHFKVEEKLEKSQLKYRFLLLQLNPHFIFNALQSVQHFIYQNDRQNSMEYLTSFSRLIRLVLENSEKDMISLDEEIEILDRYLHLQQLNRNPTFSYNIKVGKGINQGDVLVPTMLLQPLVENAVIHGIKERVDGKIELIFEGADHSLDIFIKDNGIGISPAKNANTLHKSMGMDILHKRIAELNGMGKYQINVEIGANTMDEEYAGTCIHLNIAS
ncbi:tetratricopeptide repeat-containing sensor histidine kinase [Olivibacter domesticus]|uniref:Tetratricopeptide repeat-containing protein n=1 Tax=Olivibacter domesticus TaxID=407022 RepID=A0A1H7TC95_OLID1|nr:histidine kinase [Olivibacter domesticus]SEL82363.1 Tetratricopeptide repeat-containing protein [Olivibacter domesticus]